MNKYLEMSKEVQDAVKNGAPIVALESTIISHGMPFPENKKTALEVQNIIREQGVLPATIAVIDGKLKAGLTDLEITTLAKKPNVLKMSRNNLFSGLLRGQTGATTVAATLIGCQLFGLDFFATGGIGGIHRNFGELDVSADIFELSRANCTVICSGPKAILDVSKTLEILESLGIPVIAYKQSQIPCFWYRNSGLEAEIIVNNPTEIAEMHNLRKNLKISGCQLITNPIGKEYEIKKERIEPLIKKAERILKSNRITGKDVTPFLLAKIAEYTRGESLTTNIELIKSNAALAAEISKNACNMSNNR